MSTPLNPEQQQAVTHPQGHLLVLAGAGSGKTRVLVHRIAWLIEERGFSPYSILAVTFTNKAAHEMRHRIDELLGYQLKGMWVGTFHSLSHRLLRMHWQAAGLNENFQILDSDDQHRFIKRLIKSMGLDDTEWAPRQVQWFINAQKDQGLRAAHIDAQGDFSLETLKRIYTEYEAQCQRSGLVDFAELLLRSFELLRDDPELLQHYQQRFRYLLVDEFQDTNTLQYAWLKMLAGTSTEVMIVGDDDQSIYGWRGAQIENIHKFTQDFPDTMTVRLEQNYRSTQNILQAANAVIDYNSDRLGKNLWSSGDKGEPVYVYDAYNEFDEAQFIANRITKASDVNTRYQDFAVLYRSNAQSRVIEEALIRQHIPYRIYGGLRFFDRAEIKDALSYLRLVNQRADDAAFERIVNMPTRGLGDKTLSEVRLHAREQQCSLWQASINIIEKQSLSKRANNALVAFLQLIDELGQSVESLSLHEQVDTAIQKSGLWQHFSKVQSEKSQARLDNLEELINASKEFIADPDDPIPPLSAFLTHAALESGENQGEKHQDCVQLMTLHSAKGLEFNCVFLAGVEEGLFPHKMSMEEPGRLEEERRLCYVGMTRAKKTLFISHAETRRVHGTEHYHTPSRFIGEIPKQLIQTIRHQNAGNSSYNPKASTTTTASSTHPDVAHLIGQEVMHNRFGEGMILGFAGNPSNLKVRVNFREVGEKELVLRYTQLVLKGGEVLG